MYWEVYKSPYATSEVVGLAEFSKVISNAWIDGFKVHSFAVTAPHKSYTEDDNRCYTILFEKR